MSWVPVQQRHAIERVRFEIAFSEQLPVRVVESAKRLFEQDRARLRFGDVQAQDVHQLMLSAVSVPMPTAQKLSGWHAGREASPGVVAETIALHQGGFLYESADYRDWETAYRRFQSVTLSALEKIAAVVDFRSFALDYTDRFVFQGPANQAAPGGVLNQDLLHLLTESVKAGEVLWHSHRGWFENLEGRNILMNQNVDAQDAKSHTGIDVRSLQIYTRAEFRPAPEEFSMQALDQVADQLHNLCNSSFAAVLTGEAIQMVGLKRD